MRLERRPPPRRRARAVVSARIELGHGLAMTVTGEGVETAPQLEFLRAKRCDFAQGRWLPGPASERGLAAILDANG